MQVKILPAYIIVCLILLYSCSKKFVPQHDNIPVITLNNKTVSSKPATAAASTAKPVVRTMVKRTAPEKVNVPQVIWVNDKVAKRNFDGRLYYDLEGRRYWRNNRDGKYYLYYKGIFDNPDFKAPGNN